ncbi:hypothetical protein [Thiothrix unzii]|uniref:Uncharacterized protein n=1 Tax=Thiothrix unzii TaxID=111769 RepID=A0A975FCS6_9GAMM|nr:hypothetical protein [Thiothrix unzii]QTR55475.1 hypothetical protein J9260_18425 [Thiothrix unzii]QTR55482.1 hypothetical protein J9260_18385 [Thiothrix unzii]
MQMYPDDKRRRQELAARVAAEIPAISPQIGADALAVVYEWLEANGVETLPSGHYRPFFVGALVRLLGFCRGGWKSTDFRECLRVTVWRLLGFRQ